MTYISDVYSSLVGSLPDIVGLPIRDMHQTWMARLQRVLPAGHSGAASLPNRRGTAICHLHSSHAGHPVACYMEWWDCKCLIWQCDALVNKTIYLCHNHHFAFYLQGIEQLKKEQARWVRKSRWKSIQSVFGRFSILWFSPFTQPSPKTKLESYLYSV